MKASKALTPRSIMNQRKAVESRGSAKSRTPGGADENKRPPGGATPVTPTSSNMWKAHASRRDAITPLGVGNKTNRKAGGGTPLTPSRITPGKPQQTPTRENLLITPCTNEGGLSFCHTSTVQMEPTAVKTPSAGSRAFNRSRSASSLIRSRKGGGSAKMRRSVSEVRLPADNSQTSNDAGDGELSRLSVGVRIRPLQQREHGNTIIVEGNEVKVASELGSRHSFVLDHVFGTGTTQSEVYNSMVKPLVDSAFEGYNACLFAYGQTGSGKTYSMMGSKTIVNEICEFTGIIPRFCHELINRVSNVNNESGGDSVHTSINVEVSYLEVYNEKIRDLLVTPPSKNLRVREHPVYGPYVADISKHSVNTADEIQHWISEGNKQRAIAATEMNDKSSRSHSLFTVILTQSVVQSDDCESWTHESTRRSQISLVDLAGSERIAHSSVSSDRLREGVSINRSLMTLGKVISALVEKRSFVPYRESVLTWLLKESLGGNSRTAMLATVSPCSSHQDETLATLRYAAQARTILNTVRINESPQNRIIRELRAEIERLKGEHGFSPSREMSPAGDMHPEHVLQLETEVETARSRVEEMRVELARAERSRNEAEAREAEAVARATKIEENCTKEMEKLNREYGGLKEKFLEFTKEHEKYLISCAEKEGTVEALKRRAQSADNERAAVLSKLEVAENEVERLSKIVREHLDQKSSWADRIASMETSVVKWKNTLKSREDLEEGLRKRAEKAESEVEGLLKRLDDRKSSELSEEQTEVWKRKVASIEALSEDLSEALDRERREKESLIKDLEDTKQRLEEARNEGISWATKLERKENEVAELTRRQEKLSSRLAEASGELEEAKGTLRTISVQVEAVESSKISVSVQTVSVQQCNSVSALDMPDEIQSPMTGEISTALTLDQTKEYARLKKKIMEKKKKLESLNAKLIKCDSEQGARETHMAAMLETSNKMKELEETVKKQKSDIEEMSSELELLRELETRYKNKLDQSLQDSEEAWSKKYNGVCEKLDVANGELLELRKQLKDSQERVKSLIDRLSESNLDRQVLVGEDVCERFGEITGTLEKRNADLQLKLDQKNNLILELERVANRAKEESVATQTYANELKRQYEILESNFKEAKKINQENEDRVEEFETRIRIFEEELKNSQRTAQDREDRLNRAGDRTADLERSVKERDERLVELHGQLVSLQKLLQETMAMKLNTLKSMNEDEASKKDELESKDVIAVENLRLKSDLEATEDQLNRKKKRLEKMKSHVDKLEEILITTMRQSVERKNYMLIKAEHSKMFDCMMEHSYLFHWEYLLRKARSYAHKYHIPYEFERFDEATAVVRHLLYNAKSYWFRIDFKLWFENIEKNDRWNKELDESLPWEVDFGNYYNIPDEKRGALCPLDESACQDVEPYCCKPGLICPGVWKRTIVHRHLSGLMDDTRCLLVYFDSSKNQDIKDLLNIINNMAEQIRDLLSTKT